MSETKSPIKFYEGILILCLVSLMGNGILRLLNPVIKQVLTILPGGNSQINQLLIVSLMQAVLIILGVWFFNNRFHHHHWRDIGLSPLSSTRWALEAISNGVLLFGFMLLITGILQWITTGPVEPQAVASIISTASTSWEKFVPLLVTGILAPFSEELLFRGFIYHSLRNKLNVKMSILVTACIFGGMHFDLLRAIPLILGGIWLNVLYVRTKSLWAPMIAHGVWNMAMTLTIYIV